MSREGGIAGDGVEQSGGEGSAEPVEEFQEDQAERIARGRQSVAAGAGRFWTRPLARSLDRSYPREAKLYRSALDPRAAVTCGWISPVLKVLAAGICAKRTRALISACCRGLSSLRPGMRFPVGVIVGLASR